MYDVIWGHWRQNISIISKYVYVKKKLDRIAGIRCLQHHPTSFSSTFPSLATASYIPKKSSHKHLYKLHVISKIMEQRSVLYSLNSVKLMIILKIPIYIFWNMNSLRTQICSISFHTSLSINFDWIFFKSQETINIS